MMNFYQRGDQNPERDDDIVRRYISGVKMSVMAEEYGISYSTVRRVVRKAMTRMRRVIESLNDSKYDAAFYYDIKNLVQAPEEALELYEAAMRRYAQRFSAREEKRSQRNAALAAQKLERAKERLVAAQAVLAKAEAVAQA